MAGLAGIALKVAEHPLEMNRLGGDSEVMTPQLHAMVIDDVESTEIFPGITRRALPSGGQVPVRVFDMAPGTVWPQVDVHDRDELIYIVSGELVEGETRYRAGMYLYYEPGTKHQPATDEGVRLLLFGPSVPA
ncbi:hypothetical protein GCM10009765_55410 [Fodinicola feengrottensis]|uniref:ChrR-like cupin domain-containing protein n=2 Tax=Fodinicola feengrottensis TaxID=435914 RepID=A0ABN2I589_9ACTN